MGRVGRDGLSAGPRRAEAEEQQNMDIYVYIRVYMYMYMCVGGEGGGKINSRRARARARAELVRAHAGLATRAHGIGLLVKQGPTTEVVGKTRTHH